MNTTSMVSIITPSYNQGRFLEAAISSVLEQDYSNIEYIVIDGGSRDGSQEVIRRYAHCLAYWESQPDRGQAHAINKGLKRASGEILGWLNSDDVLLPGAVRLAVETFQNRPDVDVVYGRLERIDEYSRTIPTPVLPKDRVTFGKNQVIGECIVNQPGSFWRRRVMETNGMLDESLQYTLDYEYWIRLACNGAIFERLPQAVAQFRLSPGSKTVGHTAEQAEEQMQTLDRLLASPRLAERLGITPGEVDVQARRARARIALHAAYGNFKLKQYRKGAEWFGYAFRNDPLSVFDLRWLDLAVARWRRRF